MLFSHVVIYLLEHPNEGTFICIFELWKVAKFHVARDYFWCKYSQMKVSLAAFKDLPILEQGTCSLMADWHISVNPAGLVGFAESSQHEDSLILETVPLLFRLLTTFSVNLMSRVTSLEFKARLRNWVEWGLWWDLFPPGVYVRHCQKMRLSAPKVWV